MQTSTGNVDPGHALGVVQMKYYSLGRAETLMHEHNATSYPEPTSTYILHQTAISAYNCKNMEVALRFMALACAHPEAPGQCHRNYAEMLHRCGQSIEAEAVARVAVRHDANCAEAWDTLGTILAERGAFMESRDCYQMAVRIDPMFLQALNNLAVVFHNLGQFEHAASCYRRALNLQPQSVEIQLNFANLLADSKQRREDVRINLVNGVEIQRVGQGNRVANP